MKAAFFFAFLAPAAACVADIDLAGTWRVEGEGLSGELTLPGTLGDAKLGKRWTRADFERTLDKPQSGALTLEHQYLGRAVYTRTFTVPPEDAGKPFDLVLERVMWASEVTLDGRAVGGVLDSLGTPHVHRLGRLTAGEHRLAIAVDNSPRYGFSRHSHSYGPSMQSVWHGVIGRVYLRESDPLGTVKVFARAPANRRLELVVPDGFAGSVSVDGLGVVAVKRSGTKLVCTLDREPEYWSEFNPKLYTLTVTDRGVSRTVRFGFRTFSAGRRLLRLNGNDIFTRANVENCNFARNGYPWMTKDEWVRMLRTLKEEDGVNTIRFHTWCPPEAAFAAADEVGFYLQPEVGIWSDGWMGPDAQPVGHGRPVDGFVRRELRAIADTYGNHPSFLSLCVGNELGTSDWKEADRIVREMRAYDPRMLHYYCSARTIVPSAELTLTHRIPDPGVMIREKLHPHTDWDYEADFSHATRPTISHEIGQWPVYPRFDSLLPKFDGVLRPWNIARHRDRAEKEGTRRFEAEYHAASAALNRLIYKEEVESLLRTPSCAGLQLLSVQDYTGQGEALIGWRDPFYALKDGFAGLPAFNTVWGEKNFLARFKKYDWTVGETFTATLLFRNLSDKPVPPGTAFTWSCGTARGEVSAPKAVPPGALATFGTVTVPLTTDMTKAKQTLVFGHNRWDFWVYPRERACAWPADVTVTDDFATMKTALAAGRTVLYTGSSRQSDTGTFKPVYWSSNWFPARRPLRATLGTWFDARHPLFAGFVTEHFTDWQWYGLVQGARIHRLAGLPADFRPVALSVNDFHFSMFASPLFELKVGEGRLVVCGYDLEKGTPAAKRLRASIAAYLAASPAPGTCTAPPGWLDDRFAPVQAAPETGSEVYSLSTNWVARSFAYDIRLAEPVTGTVELTFSNPEGLFRTGRVLVDGHVHDLPSVKGDYVARIGIIREDMLDGKLELRASCMTGPDLVLKSIRVVRSE